MAGRIAGPLLKSNLQRNGVDLSFENDLLYLDVNNNIISVKGVVDPQYDLKVYGTTRSTTAQGDLTVGANLSISSNNINSQVGDLFINAQDTILSQDVQTTEFLIKDNQITVLTPDTNIELTPNGTGSVDVSQLRVEGNLHATGNITADGSIQFGDDDTDSVVFEADIDSNIVPDSNTAYSLGTQQKKWLNVYTNLVNGQSISAQVVLAGGLDFSKARGNIYYVSTNGDDTSLGDKPYTPLRTIQGALNKVDASSSGPQIIFVYPGEYQEITPLVVPNNVSIIGEDLRNTIIAPDSTSQSEDVFHLEGDTTIANLTIKNFYYDSVNNTGYAFRFAPGGIINARSPYIQNITVITQGSAISAGDPRGYDAGDAGKGAWIDGSELNPLSFDASMLFHSATFITPGVDAITMTNGVRVEWLNSFTYFADRGLYALRGTTGRTGQDGSTVLYGAEVRSIGSANVYGNYGAVADGQGTLMYLINHNFAYVGAGKDVTNDNSLVIKANEVSELNNGLIYFTSTDEIGTFRVGDQFFVNLNDGSTNINIDTLNFNTLTQLQITTGNSTTVVTGSSIETGNLVVAGDSVETTTGNLNFEAASGDIEISQNTTIRSSNLTVEGDTTIAGTLIRFGDQGTDTVSFEMGFDQNIDPNQNLTFDLGTPTKQWKQAHLSELQSNDINIFDNVITTSNSNANLDLLANGTGVVDFENLSATQNLTVTGNTTLSDLDINANLTVNGNYNLIGNLTSDRIYTDTLNALRFTGDNIEIKRAGNLQLIETTISNSDLELRANGTGIIEIPKNDTSVSLSITVLGTTTISDASATAITAPQYTSPEIDLITNIVTTTQSNADLELRANGTSIVDIPNNDVSITNDLSIAGVANLQDLNINGDVTHSENVSRTGNTTVTGNISATGTLTVDSAAQFENIEINDNYITTTQSNSDLELRAAGTGDVIVPSNDVRVTGNLDINGNSDFGNITIQNQVSTEFFDTPDIDFQDNRITTTLSNSNLELRATGNVNVAANNVQIDNNLTVSSVSQLQETSVNNDLTQTGIMSSIGGVVVGQTLDAGQVDFKSAVQFEEILIDDNTIRTTSFDENLELRANGTGEVVFDENTVITNNLETQNIYGKNFAINTSVSTEILDTPDIDLQDNRITTTLSNSDLELRATGNVNVATNNVQINNNLNVNGTTTFNNSLPVNGTLSQTGNGTAVNLTTNNIIAGALSIDSQVQLDEMLIDDNFITTTTSNSNLELRAAGTGKVVFADDVNIPTNFTVQGNTIFNNISIQGSISTEFFDTPDIDFQDNRITTTLSNSDLELRASAGNTVNITNNNVQVDNDATVQGTLYTQNTTAGTIYSFNGDRIQTGNFDLDGNITIRGDLTSSTSPTNFDKLILNGNRISNPTVNEDLILQASGAGTVVFDAANIPGNVTVNAFTTNTISLATPLVNSYITTGDIVVHTNYIETTQTDSNLTLDATGNVNIATNNVQIDNNLNVQGNTNLQETTVNGSIIHNGDRTVTNINNINNLTVTNNLNANSATQIRDIQINDNFIETTSLNTDLELRSSGTGNVVFTENVEVTNNVTANSVTVNNIVLTGTADINNMFVPIDIEIFDNNITTLTSNSNLELRANGNGSVIVQNLSIKDTTVTSPSDIGLFTENVYIDSTYALEIPKGSTLASSSQGDIRYDNVNNLYEGFSSNNRITLNDLYSTDRNTSVLTNNNTIEFTIGNNLNSIINSSNLNTPTLQVDNITFDSTEITTNNNMSISANGNGVVIIGEVKFGANGTDIEFSNDLEMLTTGNGYVKFGDTTALRIPIGGTQGRPANPPIGTTRYNTNQAYLEVYDGNDWIAATGAGGQNTSEADMQELLDLYTLVFA